MLDSIISFCARLLPKKTRSIYAPRQAENSPVSGEPRSTEVEDLSRSESQQHVEPFREDENSSIEKNLPEEGQDTSADTVDTASMQGGPDEPVVDNPVIPDPTLPEGEKQATAEEHQPDIIPPSDKIDPDYPQLSAFCNTLEELCDEIPVPCPEEAKPVECKLYEDGRTTVEEAPVTREQTKLWLETVILGNLLISRQSSKGGITDLLRKLNLPEKYYTCIDNLFRSDAVKLQSLQDEWIRYVKESYSTLTIGGRILITGDSVMKPKEGRYMPAVIRLHKESGTQSKPVCFHGIHVGALGVITLGANKGIYCTPVFMQIMQGLGPVAQWEGSTYANAALTVELQEIIQMAQVVRMYGRDAYYLTDRASMNQNAFKMIDEIKESFKREGLSIAVDMIVPARKNVDIYEMPERPIKPKVGRPSKKGHKMSREIFAEKSSYRWSYEKVFIYGERKVIRYKSAIFLWKAGLLMPLRFVLVDFMDGSPLFMLCATDLKMKPKNVILAYARRFLCEEQFKVNKNVFHGFDMHFWSKHMPKNSFVRKGNKNILEDVTDSKDREAILRTLKAMETYLTLAYISQGLAQRMAMDQECGGPIHTYRQMRSNKSVKTSEENVSQVITDYLEIIFEKYSDWELVRFLKDKRTSGFSDEIISLL